MPLPVIERIAVEIADRLDAITVAGGYNFDAQDVIRPQRGETDVKLRDKLIIVMQGDAKVNKEHTVPLDVPHICWDQEFLIQLCVMPPATSDAPPLDKQINLFVADAIKAIATPATSWWVMNDGSDDLAILSQWADPTLLADQNENLTGIELVLIVTYRHPENDPYTPG